MKRFTQLFTILAMLSLGMGLSQALHHAVAHPTGSTCGAANSCSTHCEAASPENDSPPASPAHSSDECAVCATLAATKTLIPVLIISIINAAPIVELPAIPDQRASHTTVLRVLHSRAPPSS